MLLVLQNNKQRRYRQSLNYRFMLYCLVKMDFLNIGKLLKFFLLIYEPVTNLHPMYISHNYSKSILPSQILKQKKLVKGRGLLPLLAPAFAIPNPAILSSTLDLLRIRLCSSCICRILF